MAIRDVVFILCITIIVLILFEIGSSIVISYHGKVETPILKSSIYKNTTWVSTLSKEQTESYNFLYESFVGYKTKPYHGTYININENSHRETWNTHSKNTTKIYCFGGSTLFGTDSRDNYTIPSQLSQLLYQNNYNVTVTNYGTSGYDSNTEYIQLQMEIKKGNIPNIVIFYDGVNDPCNAYLNKQPGAIPNFFTRQFQYDYFQNQNKHYIFYDIVQTTSTQSETIKLLSIILNKYKTTSYKTNDINASELEQIGEDSFRYYISNVQMIKLLGDAYGFKTYFFIQPYMTSRLNPTNEETKIFNNIKQSFPGMDITCKSFYTAASTTENTNVIYIGNVFDEYNTTIYIDDCHISEYGNKIVSEKIYNYIIQ